ncbi:hypothetical protein BDR05DRAFT_944591 [Suillus weaverae]|nr:hypothetical protein BDR05DRAFT_944591 [Suillus weaverae]
MPSSSNSGSVGVGCFLIAVNCAHLLLHNSKAVGSKGITVKDFIHQGAWLDQRPTVYDGAVRYRHPNDMWYVFMGSFPMFLVGVFQQLMCLTQWVGVEKFMPVQYAQMDVSDMDMDIFSRSNLESTSTSISGR